MISAIIPTMWKPPHLAKMLPILDDHSLIGEIILIDNDRSKTDHNILKKIKKLRYYSFSEGNIYVNPAWNAGATLSKYDKLLLLNDDCLVNLNNLQKIYEHITPERGIIGFSEESYCTYKIESFQVLCDARFGDNVTFELIDPKEFKRTTGMPHIHYGSAMFMHKDNYYPIPDRLKIFFGDLYIYIKNLSRQIGNYQINGGLVMSKPSSTVSTISARILVEESKLAKEIFAEMGLENISYKIRRDV